MFKFCRKQSSVGVGQTLFPDYDGYSYTPIDSVDVPAGPGGPIQTPALAVFATGAGNIALTLYNGATATLTVPAGVITDIGPIKRILATGTTATGISVLYSAGLS